MLSPLAYAALFIIVATVPAAADQYTQPTASIGFSSGNNVTTYFTVQSFNDIYRPSDITASNVFIATANNAANKKGDFSCLIVSSHGNNKLTKGNPINFGMNPVRIEGICCGVCTGSLMEATSTSMGPHVTSSSPSVMSPRVGSASSSGTPSSSSTASTADSSSAASSVRTLGYDTAANIAASLLSCAVAMFLN